MDQPQLHSVAATFCQEGNTLGTTGDVEAITISLEFQCDEDDGPFYVIKTDGWSFDDLDEVKNLIDRVSQILKKGK